MSIYSATVKWQCQGEEMLANKYSRAHSWHFDGGACVAASSSPQIVPLPWSVEENVDPEEAFIASLSSCHMLFFLSLSVEAGYQVESYCDNATGKMGRIGKQRFAMTEVTLNPVCTFSPTTPMDKSTEQRIHHEAHEQCFIANSVTTRIDINI